MIVSERPELPHDTFEDVPFFAFKLRFRPGSVAHAERALKFRFKLPKVERIPSLYNPLSA